VPLARIQSGSTRRGQWRAMEAGSSSDGTSCSALCDAGCGRRGGTCGCARQSQRRQLQQAGLGYLSGADGQLDDSVLGSRSAVKPRACQQWACVTMGVPFIGSGDPTPDSGEAAAMGAVFFFGRARGACGLSTGLRARGPLPLCHSLWATTADEGLFRLSSGGKNVVWVERRRRPYLCLWWRRCWDVNSGARALEGVLGKSSA